ncbi:MAG: LPS export ABC transporter ATP-binding protein [Gemmatimonadales bacterium]|nr:LPS export ABC transporter ATP-binding protein [Gemmatimonadales bacterium]
MIPAGWTDRLAGRDASLRLALASLLRAADVEGRAELRSLLLEFREAWLGAWSHEPGGPQDSFAGDRLREHLVDSALPRLAADGWIEDGSMAGWQEVRAAGGWWAEAHPAGANGAVAAELARELLASVVTGPSVEPGAIPSGASLLEGRHLTKSFKGRRVVDDVSVGLRQGEIVGLLGPNGAGKTTTFYMLVGLVRADAGEVVLDGADLTRKPMYRRARSGIGYLAQEPSVFRRMTVEENILAILEQRRLPRQEQAAILERMLDELGIRHLRKSSAYSLSGGERRRLEITRALVSEPKFMLLDEPFAGVDPIAVHDIQTIVAGLRHRGIGVLITDHNVEQTLDIVDRAYIMFEGRVQASGTVAELVYNDHVSRLYLGPTLTARLRARLEAGV